jgi:hypothetical protein
MFGGTSTGNFANALNDTWVWDGTNWTLKSPATVPPAAYGPALADGPTGPVLFGGIDSGGNASSQTFVWDGTNWNLQSPVISPPARGLAGMVYDSQSGVTILFGGLSGTSQLQDTWQWDGHQWTQLNPAAVPAPRSNIGLSYDSAYNQVIVFGGQSAPELGDTWTLGGPIVVNTTLPGETAGLSYSAPIPVIGGTPPYSFAQTGSPQSLPSALNLNPSSGQITGATQLVGGYSVGVTVTDSQTLATTPTLSLTVSAATSLILSPLTLPDATAATNYNVQLSATGGNPPYIFSALNLPAGLQLNSSNQIAGQCTGGSTNASYSVTDSSLPTPAFTSVTGLTVHCNALPSIITTSPLTSAIVNTPYSASLQMTGGTAPITWSLTPGTLPSGFHLSSTGVLTGTATAPVSAQFSVTVTDLWGATFNQPYTLAIYPVLTFTTSSLPNGTAGTAYQSGVTIAASGGTGSGTYVFSATGLPNGYAVAPSSGTLSGTTTQTGLFTPTFKVTDQDAQIATKQIDLIVLNGSGITILSPTTLPPGTSGQPYSYQLQWTGGVNPSSVASTALPTWLTLNSSTDRDATLRRRVRLPDHRDGFANSHAEHRIADGNHRRQFAHDHHYVTASRRHHRHRVLAESRRQRRQIALYVDLRQSALVVEPVEHRRFDRHAAGEHARQRFVQRNSNRFAGSVYQRQLHASRAADARPVLPEHVAPSGRHAQRGVQHDGTSGGRERSLYPQPFRAAGLAEAQQRYWCVVGHSAQRRSHDVPTHPERQRESIVEPEFHLAGERRADVRQHLAAAAGYRRAAVLGNAHGVGRKRQLYMVGHGPAVMALTKSGRCVERHAHASRAGVLRDHGERHPE